MDNIGITTPPIVIKSLPTAVQSAPFPTPVAATTEASFSPLVGGDTGAFDQQAAEQQRVQAVHRAAQAVSDIFVVSDRTFTIFKDVSGQYVTRFTSLRDGKVTYIPEPNLFKLGGENDSSSIRIKV